MISSLDYPKVNERLHRGTEELDLELSVDDRLRLPDQLIPPLLGDDAAVLRSPCIARDRSWWALLLCASSGEFRPLRIRPAECGAATWNDHSEVTTITVLHEGIDRYLGVSCGGRLAHLTPNAATRRPTECRQGIQPR